MKVEKLISYLSCLMRAGIVLAFAGCSTTLYIPMTETDGKVRSVKVAQTYADARNIDMGYRSGNVVAWVTADEINHSNPTLASGKVVRDAGRAVAETVLSYGAATSMIESARGETTKALDGGKTQRHKETEKSTRHLSDNKTKVQMMEVQAQ